MRLLEVQRGVTPPLQPIADAVPGRPGEHWVRVDYGPSAIALRVRLVADTFAGLQRMRRELADWLTPELGPRPLILDDEPDVYYNAYLAETGALEELLTYGTAELRFVVPDGFGRGRLQRHLVARPDAYVRRSTPGWTYFGHDVPPNYPRLDDWGDDALLWHGGPSVFQDQETLMFMLWAKLLIEEETTNLLRDPLLGSTTPIGDPASPWQWIRPPDPAKGEEWTRDIELMEAWVGWRNLKVVANGTDRLGIRQQVTGWTPGAPISAQGRLAVQNYVQGELRFDMVAQDANGTELVRVNVATIAENTTKYSSVNYRFVSLDGIDIPPEAASLWVEIYAVGQPKMTYYVAGLQVEAKPHITALAADREAVGLRPFPDDMVQYVRAGEQVVWSPAVVNPKEGCMMLWVFPIGHRKDGMVYWSTGRPPHQGGDPTSTICVYSSGGQLIVNIGNGISAYAIGVPHDLLRLREWNVILINWRENEGLDLLVNRTLYERVYIGEIRMDAIPHAEGYLGSGAAPGAEINAIVDMFYVRRQALSREELEAFAAAPEQYLVPDLDPGQTYLLYFDDDGGGLDPDPSLKPLDMPYFSRAGTAPVWPVIEATFFLPTTGFRIDQLETLRYVQLNAAFQPGDRLVIDCERQVVIRNGWPIMDQLDLGSTFFELRRGMNSFSVGRPLGAVVEVKYEPRYL